MRFALILQTTLGLGTLFGFGYFMAERYVGPPATALAERSAAAEARAAAADVEVEWRATLAAQRRIVHAAATGPVIASLGEAGGGTDGRAAALKGALGGLVQLAGGAADVAVLGARGESLVSVGERGPQLASSSVVKLALAGAPTAGFDRIGGVPVLIASAPIVDAAAGGIRGAVVLATVLDEARLLSWTARAAAGAGILLANEDEVLVSTLPEAKRAPVALASLTGESLTLDSASYSLASRPLLDDAGVSLRVFGLARRESAAASDVIGRARVLVLALGALSILLMVALALLSPAAALATEDDEDDPFASDDVEEKPVRVMKKAPALSLDTVVAVPRKATVPSSVSAANGRDSTQSPPSPTPASAESDFFDARPTATSASFEVPVASESTDASAMFDALAHAATTSPRLVTPDFSFGADEPADLPGLRAGETLPRGAAEDPAELGGSLADDGFVVQAASTPILDLPGLRAGDSSSVDAWSDMNETSPHAATPSDLPGLRAADAVPRSTLSEVVAPRSMETAPRSMEPAPRSTEAAPRSTEAAPRSPSHGTPSDLPGLRAGEGGGPLGGMTPSDLPGLRAQDSGGRSAPSDLPGLRAQDVRASQTSEVSVPRAAAAPPRGTELPSFRPGDAMSRATPSDLPGLRAQDAPARPTPLELPSFRGSEALTQAQANRPATASTSSADQTSRRISDAVRGSGVPQPVDVLGPRDFGQRPDRNQGAPGASPNAPAPATKPFLALSDEPSDLPGLPDLQPAPGASSPSSGKSLPRAEVMPAGVAGFGRAGVSEPLDLPGLKGGSPSWPGSAPPDGSSRGPTLQTSAPFVDANPRGSGPSLDDFWKPRANPSPSAASEAPTQAFTPLSMPPSTAEVSTPSRGGSSAPSSGTPLPFMDSAFPSLRDNPTPFDEGHYRIVYNEFVGSKARLGEVVDNISYEGFSSKLRSSEKELIERHGCKAVRFQVLVKDRQVSLRPQLVR